MSGYRRGGYRRSGSSSGAGSRWMELRYAGTCKVCGSAIAKGALAFWDASAKAVTCHALACCEADGLTREDWRGSPVSGGYATVRADRRVGDAAAVSSDPFAKTRSRGYYGRDAGRCEDAPCCGCC